MVKLTILHAAHLVASLVSFHGASAFVTPSNSFISKKVSENKHRSTSSLSMGLTLYGSQGSRSPLVNWGALEVDVPLAMAQDPGKNPHPFGQIPCLTDDDDVVVFESGAILLYILDKSKNIEDTQNAKRNAGIKSWISWANASLDPICFLETPDGKVYDTGLKNPNRRIDTLDAMLSSQQFLLKEGFSLADVSVGAYLLYVPQFFPGVNLSRWPNVVRYMKDCASRPAYGQAFGPNVQNFLMESLEKMETGGDEKKKLFGMF